MNRLIFGAIVLSQAAMAGRAAAADAPAPACRYSPTGGLITLIKGATTETISVTAALADGSQGADNCAGRLSGTTALVANGKQIHAALDPNAKPLAIKLSAIPTELTSTTWNVIDVKGATIGTIDLTADAFTVGTSLGVTYRGADATLRQSGLSVVENNLGVAVVGRSVVNESRIAVPAGIPAESDAQTYWEVTQSDWGDNVLFENCTSEVEYLSSTKTVSDFRAVRLNATSPSDLASVQKASQAAETQLAGILKTDRKVEKSRSDATNSSKCVVPTATRLTFAVTNAKSQPLGVRLRLMSNGNSIPLLEIYPTISARAQIESIGLPISGAVEVSCGKKVIVAQNGGTIPVTEDDLAVGTCNVKFNYANLPADVRANLSDYGPQDLLISVHKTGDENTNDGSKTAPLTAGYEPLDPSDPTLKWIAKPRERTDTALVATLPLPKGNVDPDGVYQVRVALNTGANSTVIYRPGRAGAASATDEDAYAATVRVTGEYALPIRSHTRVFATIPVNIFGVRFPASPADLQSSSDSRVYQSAPIKAGILLGVEPWNYTTARDDWPLKPRFLIGMNLVNLENGAFTPTLLAGLAATVPVVDAPSQAGTSVALGLYWEFDLREERAFADHGHVLFALGFNILSLGTPK